MSAILAAVWLLLASPQATLPTETQVQFTFERKVSNQSYLIHLKQDGSGDYTVTYPATPPATPAETVTTPLRLHPATAASIFEQIKSTNRLHTACESRAKNVAQTGLKTLTLIDGGPPATCTWNYSENKVIVALGEEFMAFALTLDEGRKLAMEQRFDRLGLDREMAILTEAVKDGRAQGLENIAPILTAVADDTSLLERVRAQAKKLLEQSSLAR